MSAKSRSSSCGAEVTRLLRSIQDRERFGLQASKLCKQRVRPARLTGFMRNALDALVPEFHSVEELDAWWEQQPTADITVDPRLREKVKTSIRLSRMTIDGYNYLAEQMGLRSGQTLMKIVLENYLAKWLPPGS